MDVDVTAQTVIFLGGPEGTIVTQKSGKFIPQARTTQTKTREALNFM